MASNINDTAVNSDYPIAGVDNDSQGFRDNFSTIKTNFVAAKAEIETLQTTTAKLNVANNFLGNTVSGANLENVTETAYVASTTVNTSQNIQTGLVLLQKQVRLEYTYKVTKPLVVLLIELLHLHPMQVLELLKQTTDGRQLILQQ